MPDRDLVEELEATAKAIGEQPRGVAWGYALLMTQAAAEIRRLRGVAGAVSDLPAADQARLDRAYGGREPAKEA